MMLVVKQADHHQMVCWLGGEWPGGEWLGDEWPSGGRGLDASEPRTARITATPVGTTDGPTHEATVELVRYEDDSERIFLHGHVQLGSPAAPMTPGMAYDLRADASWLPDDSPLLHAVAAPLPESLDEPITIFTASCYDAASDDAGWISDAYHRSFPAEPPTISLLCGDQVYLDSPWKSFRDVAGTKPRVHYLDKYQASWGCDPDAEAGLRDVLQAGPNWFLPDDHEFWNNFPHATPLALYSLANWRHILRARARRFLSQAKRFRLTTKLSPRATSKLDEWERQLYEPTDPCEWDAWGRAAYELYHSFQTPSVDLSLSSGSGDPDPTTPPPLAPIVQTFSSGPVHGALLDTRTKRTRSGQTRTRPDGTRMIGRFIPDDDASAVIEAAGASDADIFVLVLAQPLLTQPTDYVSMKGRIKASLDFDRNMEDFEHQYRAFWNDLVQARNGRPIIAVGGDVHDSRVSVANRINLIEIVASPMALVGSLASWKNAAHRVLGWRDHFLTAIGRPPPSDGASAGKVHHLTDLLVDDSGRSFDLECRQLIAHEHDGFGTVTISQAGGGPGDTTGVSAGYDVDLALVPRDPSLDGDTVRLGFRRDDDGVWSTVVDP